MTLKLFFMSNKCIVFDLDDTLYNEIDFLKSGFQSISKFLFSDKENQKKVYDNLINDYSSGKDAFEEIIKRYQINIPKKDILLHYRNHLPNIKLAPNVQKTLESLKRNGYIMGIISDGRSITQRNKINALDLNKYILDDRNIIISEDFGTEKPSQENYLYFYNLYPNIGEFFYVGDNPAKDFISPNKLGWTTIGIRNNGKNIHSQNIMDEKFNPKFWVTNFEEILSLI